MSDRESHVPRATVIVLVSDLESPWQRCLDSLRYQSSSTPHEVLVLANGVPADRLEAVTDDPSWRFLRTRVNLGFAGGCNWAARYSQAAHLVFLNDDAVVSEGWLDALVASAEEHADIGAVGSVALSDDGRVSEAGRVLWRDGVSSALFEGASAGIARHAGVRTVDYCSASSLLVRRQAFTAAGGFDERFYPAYYEDADLALELMRRGWRIVCAGDSQVRHRSGASTALLWRRFLGLRNHRLFVDKRSSLLGAFDERPRDRPMPREVRAVARSAELRSRSLYDASIVDTASSQHEQPDGLAARATADGRSLEQQVAYLETELRHAQMETRVKDEYITYLTQPQPAMDRALRLVLREERLRTRARESLRRLPPLRYLWRRLHSPTARDQ